MPDFTAEQDAIERIIYAVADKLKVPLANLVIPASADAIAKLIKELPDDIAQAGAYLLASWIIGSWLNTGPAGLLGVAEKLLETKGLTPLQATTLVAKGVVDLDAAIQARRPN